MNATNQSSTSLRAADVMTRDITVIPRKMSLQGAARVLARAGVTGAPIVDDHGRCVGVLSATDFMYSVEKGPRAQGRTPDSSDAISKPWQIPACAPPIDACVEDYMTKDPVLVAPATEICDLARMMIDARIHRVIVVDPASHVPCGIVSSMDLLAVLARMSPTASSNETIPEFEIPGSIVL